MQKMKSELLICYARKCDADEVLTSDMQKMKSERLPDMQKMKSERLIVVLANVIQMKYEHLIHIKAKSERLI